MQRHHPQRRGAQRDGGFDEHLVAQAARFGIDQPRPERPIGDRQGENNVLDRRPQRLRDGDRQHDLRHREEHIRHPHQQIADPIVVITGNQADRHADQHRHRCRHHGDQDGDARAEQQPAVNVAAHSIGAEPKSPARRQQPVRRMVGRDVLREIRQRPGEHRHQQQRNDDREPEHGGTVAQQPAPRAHAASRANARCITHASCKYARCTPSRSAHPRCTHARSGAGPTIIGRAGPVRPGRHRPAD